VPSEGHRTTADGDARPDSDTDIMIEIGPEARIGVWDHVGIEDFIAGLFDGPVDVVKRKTRWLGAPLGQTRLSQDTGIKVTDRHGKYWAGSRNIGASGLPRDGQRANGFHCLDRR
jgi:hypothetical protein